ncbi:MAG: hypothetical protein WC755_07720 [Candidatus Woesearchaeota archaeon]
MKNGFQVAHFIQSANFCRLCLVESSGIFLNISINFSSKICLSLEFVLFSKILKVSFTKKVSQLQFLINLEKAQIPEFHFKNFITSCLALENFS